MNGQWEKWSDENSLMRSAGLDGKGWTENDWIRSGITRNFIVQSRNRCFYCCWICDGESWFMQLGRLDSRFRRWCGFSETFVLHEYQSTLHSRLPEMTMNNAATCRISFHLNISVKNHIKLLIVHPSLWSGILSNDRNTFPLAYFWTVEKFRTNSSKHPRIWTKISNLMKDTYTVRNYVIKK